MLLMRAENLTFGYGGPPLFEDVSFSISAGDRIGLVGDNGTGKSTLLKCLLGLEEIHAGKIITPRGRLAYIPQNIPTDLLDKTFYDYLLSALDAEEQVFSAWKVDVMMNELEVPENIRTLPLAHLSGGWQRMALIARTNMAEPDLILMDEPTNYLDLDKIFKFENWLNNHVKAAYIAVSHDRKFLDSCTTKTMRLRAGKIITHNVPYSHAKNVLLEEDLVAAKARGIEEAEIARIRAGAKRIRIWSNGRNPKMDKMASVMFARAEKMNENKTETYKAPRRDINFDPTEAEAKRLLYIKDSEIRTPDGRLLFKIPEMSVMRGDRIAVLAMNGAGKTQMIEALMRAYNGDENQTVRFNPQANIGYFDQHMTMLPHDKNIANYVQSLGKTDEEATKLLIAAGFPYKNHAQKIESLSNGEKARLAFLGLKIGKYNFFIMDEPTNHIDLDGQEKFEDALIGEGHTCIFVSHDRYMMEQVANKYYQIKNGALRQVNSVEPFYAEMKSV